MLMKILMVMMIKVVVMLSDNVDGDDVDDDFDGE